MRGRNLLIKEKCLGHTRQLSQETVYHVCVARKANGENQPLSWVDIRLKEVKFMSNVRISVIGSICELQLVGKRA